MTPSLGRRNSGETPVVRFGRDRRRLPAWVSGLALLLVAGCAPLPPPVEEPAGPPPTYHLGPGDRVRVTVFERADLSGEFEVDSTGRLALPLIRGVHAQGLTLPGLEEAISERLTQERFVNSKVSVDLVKSRPVCVLGEVIKPGCYGYFYGMRVSSAIAMAGGYTYRARKNEVVLTRENGDTGTATHPTLVYPGDTIEVRDRSF